MAATLFVANIRSCKNLSRFSVACVLKQVLICRTRQDRIHDLQLAVVNLHFSIKDTQQSNIFVKNGQFFMNIIMRYVFFDAVCLPIAQFLNTATLFFD